MAVRIRPFDTPGIGRFRDTLTIEKLTVTELDTGDITKAWASQGTRKCRIEGIYRVDEEVIEGQAHASKATLLVTLRTFTGLAPSNYRFTTATRTLNIESVITIEEGAHRFQQCVCREDV